MTTLPDTKTENDQNDLDNANAIEALRIAFSMLGEKLNTILTRYDDSGQVYSRVTVGEFIAAAIENLEGKK